MKRFLTAAALAVSLLVPAVAGPSTAEMLATAPPPAATPQPTAEMPSPSWMSLADFKTDIKSLAERYVCPPDYTARCTRIEGRPVEVDGVIIPIGGDRALLKAPGGDSNPVTVEIGDLPHEQRRILMACTRGCLASVHGRVNYNEKLVADWIEAPHKK
jgi:hypothetical protein